MAVGLGACRRQRLLRLVAHLLTLNTVPFESVSAPSNHTLRRNHDAGALLLATDILRRPKGVMTSNEPSLSPEVSSLKTQANDHFKQGDFEAARELYSHAIKLENKSPALYSNRSAASAKLHKYADALKDAERAIKVCSIAPVPR